MEILKLDNKVWKRRDKLLTLGTLILLIVLIVNSEPLLGKYWVRIVNTSAVYAIVAISLNLVNGFTGMFSLGQSGFMAIGAYATALMIMDPATKETVFFLEPIAPFVRDIQLPFIVALVIGAMIAAFAGFIIGFPVLRLRGDYLAIATLGFSEIIRILITTSQTITNGSLGINSIPSTNIWWVFGTLAVVVIFMLFMMKTSYGRAFKAIREDEIAAENMGIGLFKHKMISFVISAFIAGLAGGLLACVLQAVDPMQFRFLMTYNILLMIVLGGQGSVSGSVLGAFLVTMALEVLRVLDNPIDFGFVQYPGVAGMRMVIFSLLLVLIIIFWSKGVFGSNEFSWEKLLGGFKRFFSKFTRKKEGDA